MRIRFHPTRLLITAMFFVAFGSMVWLATDLRRGLAMGVLALAAYCLIEVGVTLNPAAWWHLRRRRQP